MSCLTPTNLSIVAGLIITVVGIIYGSDTALMGGLVLAGGGAALKTAKPKEAAK